MGLRSSFWKYLIRGVLLVGVMALFLVQRKCAEDTIYKLRDSLKKEKIKNDTLEQINDVQYRRAIADTATERQLRKKIDSLKIVVEGKPKEVYITKFVIKELEVAGETQIMDSLIKSRGYYPQKDDYFARVDVEIKTKTSETKYNFKFNPIDVSMVISEGKDGVFKADVKVPPFISIGQIDIVALPRETEEDKDKVSNFGFLVGGGAGHDYKTGETFGRVSGDIRYKKFYIGVGAGTNQTIDAGIKIEI